MPSSPTATGPAEIGIASIAIAALLCCFSCNSSTGHSAAQEGGPDAPNNEALLVDAGGDAGQGGQDPCGGKKCGEMCCGLGSTCFAPGNAKACDSDGRCSGQQLVDILRSCRGDAGPTDSTVDAGDARDVPTVACRGLLTRNACLVAGCRVDTYPGCSEGTYRVDSFCACRNPGDPATSASCTVFLGCTQPDARDPAPDAERPPPGAACPAAMPQQNTACDLPTNTRCEWIAEKCTAAPDLKGFCSCTNGVWTGCSREFDCYPPSTCKATTGCGCVHIGGNTNPSSSACPPGHLLGACTGNPCRPGDVPPECVSTLVDGGATKAAVCAYGQWACPRDFRFPACR